MKKLFILLISCLLVSCAKRDIDISYPRKIESTTEIKEMSKEYKSFISNILNDNCKGLHFYDSENKETVINPHVVPLFYSWFYDKTDFFIKISDKQYYGFRKTFQNPKIEKIKLTDSTYIISITE